MNRKTALILVTAMMAASPALARQHGQRPVMAAGQGMMATQQEGEAPAKMLEMRQKRMQERAEGRATRQEERINKMCDRGSAAVERMKQSGIPEEMVSMADRHQKERCEMTRRHHTERTALMEQMRQNGIRIPEEEAPLPPEEGI